MPFSAAAIAIDTPYAMLPLADCRHAIRHECAAAAIAAVVTRRIRPYVTTPLRFRHADIFTAKDIRHATLCPADATLMLR